MALTPDVDQFSQFLRLAFLRSPNFVTGVSGWTINQDGSAEFNNLTIRGTFKGTNFIINSSGAFFYNGTPALGTLILAITAPGVTSDPFGNQIPSSGVFNAGTWNASGVLTSHFGINNSGDTFLVNSSGNTVRHEASADGSVRTYNTSGEAAGNLVASEAPAAGTDGPGNHYIAGYSVYAAAVAAQLFSNGLFMYTGSLAAGWTIGQANISSSGNNWVISAGSGGSGTGSVIVAATSDANNYVITRLDKALAVSFSINSTTPLTIFSVQLGVGTYEIDIWAVTLNSAAADAAQYAFAFTGTATAALVDYTSMTTGTATVGYFASATLTSTFNAQGAANNQKLEVHLGITVSVAGTLTFTGAELVAANPVTMFAGSRMRVCPV